jgi:hypothetical protein
MYGWNMIRLLWSSRPLTLGSGIALVEVHGVDVVDELDDRTPVPPTPGAGCMVLRRSG